MRSRRASRVLLVFMLVAGLGVAPLAPSRAYVPRADRTLDAIARVNKSSGRSQALQLELTMRIGERDPIARGNLISHPSGLARLELRGFNGRVDRYLLSGSELSGAKDGIALDYPQPMLQPLFFLQPSTGATLRAALDAFGVRVDSVGLATCGEDDCYVIGDPRLASTLSPDELDARIAADRAAQGTLRSMRAELGDSRLGKDLGQLLALRNKASAIQADATGILEFEVGPDARLTRLWVDTENLQVRRIDRDDGVFTIFGPVVSHDRLMLPAWFEIHEPEADPIRFEIDRAVPVNAPPQAFGQQWLFDAGTSPASSDY